MAEGWLTDFQYFPFNCQKCVPLTVLISYYEVNVSPLWSHVGWGYNNCYLLILLDLCETLAVFSFPFSPDEWCIPSVKLWTWTKDHITTKTVSILMTYMWYVTLPDQNGQMKTLFFLYSSDTVGQIHNQHSKSWGMRDVSVMSHVKRPSSPCEHWWLYHLSIPACLPPPKHSSIYSDSDSTKEQPGSL